MGKLSLTIFEVQSSQVGTREIINMMSCHRLFLSGRQEHEHCSAVIITIWTLVCRGD